MTDQNALERHLALEGSYNIRDVGGYITADGQRVRWRRLLRSDSLHALTPAGQQALRGHGLRTIIDLRRPSEASQRPNVFAAASGMIYRNLPLFDDEAAPTIDAPADTLEELYTRYVDGCQPQLRAILATIAGAATAPLLVHCAVGKDRTGLVIALTLGALGVEPATIADDYALSHARLAPLFALERPSVAAENHARYDRMVQSPRETMLHVLAHIGAHYGGLSQYIATLGVSAEQVALLREHLLESA
ncbi:MAG TPA: tyrosine-protein phosphatase [Kouleothrix sp.]|uniref:tyrosine-protein phosphatase n=1 Tax=Kouleothrix sp. TaxID=2779161 RepID=UPI002C57CB4A|nr:tyrosine-protein phosphatase [Kouleothrix sp.]HRC74726.1 tyrosine-protein phosphatase [Kouleothrix sp.]